MKISTTGPSKNFSTHDTGRGVFCTNAFAFDADHAQDFIEWDLTDTDKPVLRVKMTKDPTNKSFARAFACYAISLFGRWETTGANDLPKLPGRRGQGAMDSPKFDLRPVAEKHGYPCKASAMPPTTCHIDADVPDHMNVNRLIDLYFNFIPGADGMNDNISPNASRHLNIQIQCGRGATNIEGAHAGGWSGADEFMRTVVDGWRCRFGYKHETHMGNSFPLISLDFGDIRELRVDLVIGWIIEHWEKIASACRDAGKNLFDVTADSLRASWIDSPHIGCEVLGGAIGEIRFNRLGIDVADTPSLKANDPARALNTPAHEVLIDGVKYVPAN